MKRAILKGALSSAIGGAKAGHKNDARRAAGFIAELLQSDQPIPAEAKKYLVEALQAIADGTPGSKAFNTSGRRGVRDSLEKNLTSQMYPAYYMQNLLDAGLAKSKHDASVLTEQHLDQGSGTLSGRDASSIRKSHRKLFPPE